MVDHGSGIHLPLALPPPHTPNNHAPAHLDHTGVGWVVDLASGIHLLLGHEGDEGLAQPRLVFLTCGNGTTEAAEERGLLASISPGENN